MNPMIWVAIAGLVVTGLIQAVGLVIWGARLTQRVKTLEQEMEPLRDMKIQVARMEVKIDNMGEQLKDLNAQLRWLNPATYEPKDLQRPGGR
jgi:hypothetical protein